MIWPLSRLSSLKAKFSVIIVVAVGVTALMSIIGLNLGWPVWIRPVISAAIALGMVQLVAKGFTSPLRQMTMHAKRMATGDYSHRVSTDTADEVGQLAEAFNAMATDLADVDQQRRALIANVSHELRTPIAALQVQVENLIDGVSNANAESLGAMLLQTERLGRLVSELLDLSRLEAGSAHLDAEQFDVGVILAESVDEVALQHPSAVFELNLGDEVELLGDAERVRQIASNLIQNAVRHSPADAPIELVATREANGVVVQVVDSGPGIPPDERHQVFERFYRGDGSQKSAGGGTGLGLAIARSIAELHGGAIRVEQNTPNGCRMVVVLPDLPPNNRD